MKLHFFPALLPLTAVLPWVLSAVGALASAAHSFQHPRFRRHRRAILGSAVICFALAVSLLIWRHLELKRLHAGSRAIPESDFSPSERIGGPEELVALVAPSGSSAVDKRFNLVALREIWFRILPSRPLSTPALAGDLLLIGTQDGKVVSLRTQDGEEVWRISKRAPVYATPTVVSGRAYVGEGLHTTQSSRLTAIALPSGLPIWEREFLGHLESQVLVDPGSDQLWVSAGQGGLWSLKAKSGIPIWHQSSGHADSTPLLHAGRLWMAFQPDEGKYESVLLALDPATGEERSRVVLPGQPWGSPRAVDDGIHLTTAIGRLASSVPTDRGWSHRVSLEGEIDWSVELPGMPLMLSETQSPGGLIVHTLKHGVLVAQNRTDGSIRWSAQLASSIYAPATLCENSIPPVLAVATLNGTLELRDALSGELLQRHEIGADSTSSPMCEGDRLYVATPGGVSAFQMSAGRAQPEK